MKRFFGTAIAAALAALLASCSNTQTAERFVVPDTYTVAFADEFDGALDEKIWENVSFGPRKGGYWAPEQSFTRDGNLVIETSYRENGDASGYYTGCLNLRSVDYTYGYYEIRCKVDDIRGAWSAFWLMPDNISHMEQKAQDGCELDIFETAVRDKIQNALHYDGYAGNRKRVTRVDDLYDGFHTFGLDWKRESLHFYYDGKLLWEVTDPDLISQYPANLIVSTEINGDYHDGNAAPTPSRWMWFGCGLITDKQNTLPSEFVVDYVRVYDNGQLQITER